MVATAERRKVRLRACGQCGGDAFLDLTDGREWRCLLCGRLVADDGGASGPLLTTTPGIEGGGS
jgi:hypothetical protein